MSEAVNTDVPRPDLKQETADRVEEMLREVGLSEATIDTLGWDSKISIVIDVAYSRELDELSKVLDGEVQQ